MAINTPAYHRTHNKSLNLLICHLHYITLVGCQSCQSNARAVAQYGNVWWDNNKNKLHILLFIKATVRISEYVML